MPPEVDWYAPDPAALPAGRVSLHFGLRSDDLFYRQLLVPRAGRIWFVRELSWALGALALMPELDRALDRAPSPMLVAHGIEAMASKLAWLAMDDDDVAPRRRILGRRAFERDRRRVRWSFRELSRPEHYVRNTHRQNVVSALRMESGLGLVHGRSYSDMRPSGRGLELAEEFLGQRFGRGGGTLASKLVLWIGAPESDPHDEIFDGRSAREALSPLSPSEGERRMAASILLRGTTEDAETRRALARVFRSHDSFPSIESVLVPALRDAGREAQAREVGAARAFGSMLDAIVGLAGAAAAVVREARGRIRCDRIAEDASVVGARERLRERVASYAKTSREAETFDEAPAARTLVALVDHAAPADVLRELLGRAPEVFDVIDGTVGPGDLIRRVASESDDDESSGDVESSEADVFTDRTFYLEGFYELVRDCSPFTEMES